MAAKKTVVLCTLKIFKDKWFNSVYFSESLNYGLTLVYSSYPVKLNQPDYIPEGKHLVNFMVYSGCHTILLYFTTIITKKIEKCNFPQS